MAQFCAVARVLTVYCQECTIIRKTSMPYAWDYGILVKFKRWLNQANRNAGLLLMGGVWECAQQLDKQIEHTLICPSVAGSSGFGFSLRLLNQHASQT